MSLLISFEFADPSCVSRVKSENNKYEKCLHTMGNDPTTSHLLDLLYNQPTTQDSPLQGACGARTRDLPILILKRHF